MRDGVSGHRKDRGGEAEAAARQPWLAAGAIIGLVVALVAIGRPRAGDGKMPPAAVAIVNGEQLREEALDRALAMLAGDRRMDSEPIERRDVLERLIEEELLVQRALELGLVRSDASVRSVLVRAMIDSIVLDASSETVSEQQLREYFGKHRSRFARPATVEVERVLVRERGDADDARARARAAAELLRAGAAVDYVRTAHGDSAVVPMPSGPLLLSELREHVGPAVAQTLSASSAGDIVGPLESNGSLLVLRVRAVSTAVAPEFEAARSLVEAAYRKDSVDQAMRSYLSRLRDRAAIVVRDDVAAGSDS